MTSKEAYKKSVEKGENANKQHLGPIPAMFSTLPSTNFVVLGNLITFVCRCFQCIPFPDVKF